MRPAAYLASLAVFQSGPPPLDLHGSVLLQLAPWCRTRNLGGDYQETLPSWWQSPCDKSPCFEKIDVFPRHSVSPSRPRHLVCHADGILAQSRPPCITHPTVYLGNSTTSWSLGQDSAHPSALKLAWGRNTEQPCGTASWCSGMRSLPVQHVGSSLTRQSYHAARGVTPYPPRANENGHGTLTYVTLHDAP